MSFAFALKSFLKILLVTLLLSAASPKVLASETETIRWDCYGLIVPNMGVLIEDGEGLGFSAEELSLYHIYALSQGENQVYRLIPLKQPGVSRAVKFYTQERAFDNDVLALEVLTPGSEKTFIEIIGHSLLGPQKLELTDLRGRSLKEILGDTSIDARARALLLERYHGFLEAQVKSLTARFGPTLKISRSYQGTWSVHFKISDFPEAGKTLKIFLRAENILVESKTANLYLNSPY